MVPMGGNSLKGLVHTVTVNYLVSYTITYYIQQYLQDNNSGTNNIQDNYKRKHIMNKTTSKQQMAGSVTVSLLPRPNFR